MALDPTTRSFILERFPQYSGNIDSLSAIPGFDNAMQNSYEMMNAFPGPGMQQEAQFMRINGRKVAQGALQTASTNPVAFVKSAMSDSIYKGNTALLTSEIQYLSKNNVSIDEIKSIYTKIATQKAQGEYEYAVGRAANPGSNDVFGSVAIGTLAFFIPVIGAEIGTALMEAGILTSAAVATEAAIAASATAAEITAAATAATATATAVGTAVASTTVQVAQGVPVETAVQNATVNAVVQTQSPTVANEIAKVTEMPGFSDAVTSAGVSYAATIAKGGTAEQAAQNAVGGVVGSITGTATDSKELGAAAGVLGAGGTAAQAAAAGAGAYATSQTAADAATARKEIAATEAAQDAPVITGDSGGVASADKPMIDLVQRDMAGATTSSLPEVTVTASPSADVGVQPVVTDVVSRPTSGTLPEVSVTASQDNEPGIQPVTTDTQTAKKDTSVAPTNMGTLPTVQVTGTTDDEGLQPVTDVATVDKTTSTTDATQATDKTVEDDKTDTTEPDDKDQYLTILSGTGTPKPRPRTRTDLSTTLQAPFYPTSTLGQALTGYRGAGEIEGKKTGKPRKNVWNEESLRLKDALGL